MALALISVSHDANSVMKMVPLHSLGQDDQNEVQHEFLVM